MLMMVMLVYWRLNGAGPMSVVTMIIYLLQLTFHQHPCSGVKNFLQTWRSNLSRGLGTNAEWKDYEVTVTLQPTNPLSSLLNDQPDRASLSESITEAELTGACPRPAKLPSWAQPSYFPGWRPTRLCLGSCLTSHSDQRIYPPTIYCNITSHPPFIFYPYINIFKIFLNMNVLGHISSPARQFRGRYRVK